MHQPFKQITLSDLLLRPGGTLPYRLIIAVFGIALKIFFRRIETVDAESVPRGTGVIFVMNHPNGLIDPALVFVALPRRISFLAKSTLFRMPVIGWILRTVGALPLYRRIDAGEDVSKNQKTFELCRELLRNGGSIALFPEGVSHNSPKLLPLKSGASRIAIGAASIQSDAKPVAVKIVPVGLYYTNKTTFRSEALLHFGEAFAVEPVELDADGQPPREAVKKLTTQIDASLRDVTLNAESEAELHTAKIAEEIFASAEANENLGEKFEFQRKFVAATTDDINVEKDKLLHQRLVEYDKKLDEYGIEAEHLSLAQFSRSSVVKQALIQIWPLAVISPLALVGIVLHFPAYQLLKVSANWYSQSGADDVASTAKVLGGMVFMPLTWMVAAAIGWYFFGWKIGAAIVPVSFVCGYAALYTLEEIAEMRGWAKAIWLFLTSRERFLRLFVERRELHHELSEFD